MTQVERLASFVVRHAASILIGFPRSAKGLRECSEISLRRKSPKTFTHRGVSPLFDDGSFTVNANDTSGGLELWTANAAGAPTMKASASW